MGLKNEEGKIINTLNIEHSEDGIIWRRAEGERQHVRSKTGARAVHAKEAVKLYIKSKGIVTQCEIECWAASNNISQRAAVSAAKALVEGCRGISDQFLKFYKYKRPAPIGLDGKRIKGEQPSIFTTIAPDKFEATVSGAAQESESARV